MLTTVLAMQKETKAILSLLGYFAFFMVIYTIVDSLNMSYDNMAIQFGAYLVVLNIVINILMSGLSAIMFNFSTALVKVNGKEGKATNLANFSILFGLLTYGCTSCVIAFFAVIGITFSVAVLPFAGLPYKILALVLLVVGLVWLIYEIKNTKCKVVAKK
jgi:hypothetical protein